MSTSAILKYVLILVLCLMVPITDSAHGDDTVELRQQANSAAEAAEDIETRELYYRLAIAAANDVRDETLLASYRGLQTLLWQNERFTDAEQLCKGWLEVAAAVLGEQSSEFSDTAFLVATTHLRAKNRKMAADVAEMGLKSVESQFPRESNEVFTAQSIVLNILFPAQMYERADRLLDRQAAVLTDFAPEDLKEPTQWQRDIFISLSRIRMIPYREDKSQLTSLSKHIHELLEAPETESTADDVCSCHLELATAFRGCGRFEDAYQELQRFSSHEDLTFDYRILLGQFVSLACFETGRAKEAAAESMKCLDLIKDDPDSDYGFGVRVSLARSLGMQDKHVQAITVLRQAIAIETGQHGDESEDLAFLRMYLAHEYQCQERFEEAREQLMLALAKLESSKDLVFGHSSCLEALRTAEACVGNLENAEKYRQRATERLLENKYRSYDVATADYFLNRSREFAATEEWGIAEFLLASALSEAFDGGTAANGKRQEIYQELSRNLTEQGRKTEAQVYLQFAESLK